MSDIVERLKKIAGGPQTTMRAEGNDTVWVDSRFVLPITDIDEAAAEIERLRAENERLRGFTEEAAGFVVLHAARWSRDNGWPDTTLHPVHYDLARALGADLSRFTRAALSGEPHE